MKLSNKQIDLKSDSHLFTEILNKFVNALHGLSPG